MEQIIKVSSEQGFSETWVAADVGTTPPTQELLDFIIPGNSGTYDLGKCFVNINVEVVATNETQAATAGATSADTALYNNDIVLEQNDNTTIKYMADAASLVRNAEMFSAERGMVESIRRVNVLRGMLWNMESDKAEQHDGNNNLGTFQGRRGIGQQTSQMVQIMGGNTNVNGVGNTNIRASSISRDLRIPLSDLFGVGSALWNSDVYGSTRIHMEMDMNRLRISQLGGSENTDIFDAAGVNTAWGAMDSYSTAAGGPQADIPATGTLGVTAPLITTIAYDNYQFNLPFYVGQLVVVNCTGSVAGAINAHAIIDRIEYGLGTNNTNPPSSTTGQVRIYTRQPVHTVAAAPEAITAITVKASLSVSATAGAVLGDRIRVNHAEIVLTSLPSVTGPSSIDYRTYSTEETQGSSQTPFTKQIICEPNAQNLFVANCNTGQNDHKAWTRYRMAINNNDVAGNRDINVGTPLHRDRVLRTFNNRGQNVSNMSFNQIQVAAPQGANQNQSAWGPIFETLPLTQNDKIVNFRIEQGGGAEDVIFYKELVKSI